MAEYKDYTDDEYRAMDEYYTKNTIMPVGGKPGVFARHQRDTVMMVALDNDAASYVQKKVKLTNQTPSQIISSMLRREMAIA
jgi:hypothetical protein